MRMWIRRRDVSLGIMEKTTKGGRNRKYENRDFPIKIKHTMMYIKETERLNKQRGVILIIRWIRARWSKEVNKSNLETHNLVARYRLVKDQSNKMKHHHESSSPQFIDIVWHRALPMSTITLNNNVYNDPWCRDANKDDGASIAHVAGKKSHNQWWQQQPMILTITYDVSNNARWQK